MAKEGTPVNPDSSFDFIDKLPSELIKEFFCLLPKNLALDVLGLEKFTLPKINPTDATKPWYRRLEIKRWLFSQVYVYPGFGHDLNWYNDELQRWLLLPQSHYYLIEQQHSPWPFGVVLCPMSMQWGMFMLFSEIPHDDKPIHKFWLHPEDGGNVCAISLPLRSNQHLSRLTLGTYTFDGSVSTNHRVDSLQLNGRHPHLDKVIDLSSVKQLSVLTPRRYGFEVFEYASKFTLLKDLFVGIPVTPENMEAFPKTVTRLVLVMDSLNYISLAETAAKFNLLTYCEVTEHVVFFNWPRTWRKLKYRVMPDSSLHEMLIRFKERHFEQLKTLVLYGYPLRIIRRSGIWVSTENVDTGVTWD